MKQYVDKSVIIAEIERRKSELQSRITELGTFESNTLGLFQDMDSYDEILSFLDTLEVKDVELEKEIKLYKMRNPIIQHREDSLNNYMSNVAKHFFELVLKAQKGE